MCFTLLYTVNWAINLDKKVCQLRQKGMSHVKISNFPFSQFLKNKGEITLYHLKLYSRLHLHPKL